MKRNMKRSGSTCLTPDSDTTVKSRATTTAGSGALHAGRLELQLRLGERDAPVVLTAGGRRACGASRGLERASSGVLYTRVSESSNRVRQEHNAAAGARTRARVLRAHRGHRSPFVRAN